MKVFWPHWVVCQLQWPVLSWRQVVQVGACVYHIQLQVEDEKDLNICLYINWIPHPLPFEGVRGVVLSIWRPCPTGGLGQWLCFPEPQAATSAEQPQLWVLQGEAQHQRGQGPYLKLIFHDLINNSLWTSHTSPKTSVNWATKYLPCSFFLGDIPASLCWGHRRALCMDGRYAQLHWCGESSHCYPQPDCKHFLNVMSYLSTFCKSYNSCRFCEYVPDWALHSLWVYLWGDAPEGQHPYWKTGWWSVSWGARGIRFIIRPNKKRLVTFESHLCLRISAPAQWAGPHWARSRLWRQRSTLPATGLARRRGSSVNLHFSHISTVPKVLASKSNMLL